MEKKNANKFYIRNYHLLLLARNKRNELENATVPPKIVGLIFSGLDSS
jgi:hypothetical protein